MQCASLKKLTPPSQPRLPRTFPEEYIKSAPISVRAWIFDEFAILAAAVQIQDRNLVNNVFHPTSFLLPYFLNDARSGT